MFDAITGTPRRKSPIDKTVVSILQLGVMATLILSACSATQATPTKPTEPIMSDTSPKVLIVLTSHGQLGDTGKDTGFYLSEVSHPYQVFSKAGYELTFISPKGGAAPMDGVDRADPANAAFLDNADLMAQVRNTLHPSKVDPKDYQGIFYAGGHGTMWDFREDANLQALSASIYDAGGVVGAVCHGPSGIVDIKLGSGDYLVKGKDVTGFTNGEEAAVELTNVVPFLLEDALKANGATFHGAENFQANVVTSERLVTGQNPASAQGVAKAMVGLIEMGE